MLSDEIRARLAQLHRSNFVLSPDSEARIADTPWHVAASNLSPPAATLSLERAEECENASGRHLRFRRPLAEVWPAVDEAVDGRIGRASAVGDGDIHPELSAVADHFPRGTLFLDLETCGFAGSSVFLAGLVWQVEGRLVVDQLFARHWAEERAILETLWQIARENRVLVTFNGKSFDWPMVHDRSTRHHLGRDTRGQTALTPSAPPSAALGRRDERPQLVHCDLLHHARRRWKRLLPNCKLQTLERYVCDRYRRDDLAGAQVPLAYCQFVRTGATRQVSAILRHNALDLATLVQVSLKLLSA